MWGVCEGSKNKCFQNESMAIALKNNKSRLGIAAHTYNPSTLGGWGWLDHLRSGVQDQSVQHGETPNSTKNAKVHQAWWCLPEIPATQEAEAGESLEPRRQKLQ